MIPFEAGVSGAELFFVISGIVIFYRPLRTRQDQERAGLFRIVPNPFHPFNSSVPHRFPG